ncbi:MAG: hypothetical protein HGB04_09840 [Chlorobiaceae bacterium]|nr:hypothetical protein [Chlorobiaceae bacterium]
MEQSNPSDMVKNVVGAAGTALIAPIAPPILHGIAGIAVVGLGLFAAGSLIMKAGGAIGGVENPLKQLLGTKPAQR